MQKLSRHIWILSCLTLCACQYSPHIIRKTKLDGPPAFHVNVAHIPNATPKLEMQSSYGNPDTYVAQGQRYFTLASSEGYRERGIASWYGTQFHGLRTSNRERYDMLSMSAAHKTLPLPTYVRVTNLENGRSIIVRVNDRGPFVDDRIIDLSYAAAKKLDMLKQGTAVVEIEALAPHSLPNQKKANSHYFIQLAAFKRLKSAQKLLREAKAHYPKQNLFIYHNPHQYYTVRMGPFQSGHYAGDIAKHLEALGFAKPNLVKQAIHNPAQSTGF